MNANAFSQKDYENEPPSGPKKTNPNKPNFKPGEGFSAYYKRDCNVAEFTLNAAEGGIAMTLLGAFLQRVAARPEKNVDTMNVLAIKSYKFYLDRSLLLSNY